MHRLGECRDHDAAGGQPHRMRVAQILSSNGHVMATHELRALGCTPYALRLAVKHGDVLHPRQGWYCSPELDDAVIRAIRVGGRLGCTSAARHHGLWTRGTRLHVEVKPGSARLREPTRARRRIGRRRIELLEVHWADSRATGNRQVTDTLGALLGMAVCESPELVVAAADSALRLELITRAEWSTAISTLPRRLQLRQPASGWARRAPARRRTAAAGGRSWSPGRGSSRATGRSIRAGGRSRRAA